MCLTAPEGGIRVSNMNNTLRRYTPHVIVFFGSLAIMIIELVASRLVAKYFGNSLYTWTGVIGVILGGISLGNYVGGRLADRYQPSQVVIPVLLISSAATLLILGLDALLNQFMTAPGSTLTWVIVLRSVVVIALLFLLPASALGAISPIMAKYALLHRAEIGQTVGNIYAVSSIGSIAGTFLAGFVLIPLFDLRIVVAVVGLVVASLGFLVQGRRAITAAGLTIVALLGTATFIFVTPLAAVETGGDLLYSGYSRYSYIKVIDRTHNGATTGERVLIMDGLIHNRHDLRDSNHLLYEYENIFEAATWLTMSSMADRHRLRALTLGGGALTFPSFLARNYHPAENTVVEIDPRVASIADRFFDLPTENGPSVLIGDARAVAADLLGKHTYDVVYLDAFNSFSVPYHLTTVEFTRMVAGLLKPGGLLLANTIDVYNTGGFLAGYYNTLKRVFPNVKIYSDRTMNTAARSTFVLSASDSLVLPDVLQDSNGQILAFAMDDSMIDQLRARNGTAPFTDYYAPVDNLMAPVFLQSVK